MKGKSRSVSGSPVAWEKKVLFHPAVALLKLLFKIFVFFFSQL